MEDINNQVPLNFELGPPENMKMPLCMSKGFQHRARQDTENLNSDTFFRLPVTSAQCAIGTEKDPDAGILSKFEDDEYSQGYGKPEEAFRALPKKDNLKAYLSDHALRSSNVRVADIGYNLYVFDMRYQQNFTASQPVKVGFKFGGVVLCDVNVYALVLSKKFVSISGDG